MDPIRFFLPGPVFVRPDVLAAMTRPPVGHRSAEFKELYASLGGRLQKVFQTERDVYVATSSSTLVMEASLVSTVPPDKKVLCVTGGAFSERWRDIAHLVGRKADRLAVPWGEAVDPEQLRRALRNESYAAVTVVHSETSTGVMNPLKEIGSVVQQESNALLMVDTVSSLGGAPVETDGWGLDVVLAGTQKALALPPGLTLFSFSSRAEKRAEKLETRGYYTDFLRYRDKHRTGGTITTPAISLVYALDRQLDVIGEEGIEERWARHRLLRRQVERWVDDNGLQYASAAGSGSWTVSCLAPPSGVTVLALVRGLGELGFTVAPGYGPWKESTFRIGHMGEIRGRDLGALLAAVEETMTELSKN